MAERQQMPQAPFAMAPRGPVQQTRQGAGIEALGDTEIVKLVQSLLALPGDVYAGRIDPNSDEGAQKAAQLALLLTMGGKAAAPVGKALAAPAPPWVAPAARGAAIGGGFSAYRAMRPDQEP